MKTVILFVLFSCFLTQSVGSFQTPPATISEFEFGGLHFGDPPAAEMICTRGPCPSAQLGVGVNHQKTILSGYKYPVDLTHLAQVEISAPRYDFFFDQFVKASFTILCDPDLADICTMTVIDALDERYQLSLEQEDVLVISPRREATSQIYRTASGKRVTLHRDKIEGRWQNPAVQLYDQTLMETVRRAANPQYIPK